MGAFPSSEERHEGSVVTDGSTVLLSHLTPDYINSLNLTTLRAEAMGLKDITVAAATVATGVGQFGEPSRAKCEHYAAFAAHLTRRDFDAIYWILFFFVIAMLFTSSWKYDAAVSKASNFRQYSHEYKRQFKMCMYWCLGFSLCAVAACVMEVFALLALQFCDGEDLMSLYWSTWTVMQVGGVIAIFGILLQAFNQIRENKQPAWALALGTPILVVAGFGYALQNSMKKRVKRGISRSRSRSRSRAHSRDPSVLPISREDTLRNEDNDRDENGNPEMSGRLLGWAPDGGPIFQFAKDPGEIDLERGEILGRNAEGAVTVVFKKRMTIVVPKEEAAASSDPEKADASDADTLRPPRQAVVRIQSPEPMTPFSPFPSTPITPSTMSSTSNLNKPSRG